MGDFRGRGAVFIIALYELFTAWMPQINPTDSANVPSGAPMSVAKILS